RLALLSCSARRGRHGPAVQADDVVSSITAGPRYIIGCGTGQPWRVAKQAAHSAGPSARSCTPPVPARHTRHSAPRPLAQDRESQPRPELGGGGVPSVAAGVGGRARRVPMAVPLLPLLSGIHVLSMHYAIFMPSIPSCSVLDPRAWPWLARTGARGGH